MTRKEKFKLKYDFLWVGPADQLLFMWSCVAMAITQWSFVVYNIIKFVKNHM